MLRHEASPAPPGSTLHPPLGVHTPRRHVNPMPPTTPSPMYVGIGRIALRMPQNGSLKDKRQIIRSVIQRTRNQFAVAIAEVGGQDAWSFAELGLSYVSNDARHAEEVIAKAIRSIEEARLDAEVVDTLIQVEQY